MGRALAGSQFLVFLLVGLIGGARSFLPRNRSSARGPPSASASASSFVVVLRRASTSTDPSAPAGEATQSLPKPKQQASSPPSSSIGKLTFLVPENADSIPSKFGTHSPVDNPTLLQAVTHVAQKTFYFCDGLLDYEIVSTANHDKDNTIQSLKDSELLIAIGLTESKDIAFAQEIFQARKTLDNPAARHRLCHFALECGSSSSSSSSNADGQLPALVGPFDETQPSLASTLVPWSPDATARRMREQMLDLFSRWTTDDFCYALVLFLNQFSAETPIEWVRYRTDASWEKGPLQNAQEFYAMVTECRDCVLPAVQDPPTRECLTRLAQIDPRDQATSYRTLVSYESDLLTQFSLCVFTKRNIFRCDATIPKIPVVPTLRTWRGREFTEEDGRALLVGHLADGAAPEGSLGLDVSWKVACGANVAYDQFPSQNQLFYPAARGRDLWYDPVFRVETLDGRHVWCKRHYKVRPQKSAAGTFRLSVLDNGVTSDEFWTIVAAADDLSWIVFHYAGAARAVGLRYLGGLLCTPDGSLPPAPERPRIWDAFRSAGIQPWELYAVDNRQDTPGAVAAGPPPLDFYRSAVLERRAAAAATDQ